MRTINIKGKEYVPVSERIKEFRKEYEDWRLVTELVSITETSVVFKASVYSSDGLLMATGHAHEDKGASNINKTSYVENCETSAVGRALGMLGIGVDASVASADEVANAIDRQETMAKPVAKNNVAALMMACDEKGAELSQVLSYYGVETADEMTMGQWNDAMTILSRRPSK